MQTKKQIFTIYTKYQKIKKCKVSINQTHVRGQNIKKGRNIQKDVN